MSHLEVRAVVRTDELGGFYEEVKCGGQRLGELGYCTYVRTGKGGWGGREGRSENIDVYVCVRVIVYV